MKTTFEIKVYSNHWPQISCAQMQNPSCEIDQGEPLQPKWKTNHKFIELHLITFDLQHLQYSQYMLKFELGHHDETMRNEMRKQQRRDWD